jgi:hypothetical protein
MRGDLTVRANAALQFECTSSMYAVIQGKAAITDMSNNCKVQHNLPVAFCIHAFCDAYATLPFINDLPLRVTNSCSSDINNELLPHPIINKSTSTSTLHTQHLLLFVANNIYCGVHTSHAYAAANRHS